MKMRWRLQHLAEQSVGSLVRQQGRAEDEAVKRLKRIGGRGGRHR